MSLDAKGYDSTNKPHLKWAQKLVDLINKYDKKRHFQTIIDIGCGSGNITKWLATHFEHGQLYGIDISPEMIGFAEQNSKTETIEYVLTDLSEDWSSVVEPIKSLESKVSLVFSNYCIMYIGQKLQFVQNLRRLMTPGAKAYFSISLIPDPILKLTADLKEKFGQYVNTPSVDQQMQSWTQLFEANGFSVEYQEMDCNPINFQSSGLIFFLPFISQLMELCLKSGIHWKDLSDDIQEGLQTLFLDQIVNSDQSSVDWKIMESVKEKTLPAFIEINMGVGYLVCKKKL